MYETEEQQVEAIKKWWHENGKSIVAGVVIGLGGVLGWQAWTQHSADVAAQASNTYDQLVAAVDSGNTQPAEQLAQHLHDEFGSTPYSAFAYLMQAKLRHDQDDKQGAKSALEQAIEQAPDQAIRSIAVLRLARLQISAGELDAAQTLLDSHAAPSAFQADYAAVRGDIARIRGDHAAARDAYQQAIAGNAGNAEIVKLKLQSLPAAPAT